MGDAMPFGRTRKSIPSPFSFLLLLVMIGGAARLAAQSLAPVSWNDLPPAIQQQLERSGLDRARFPAWTADLRARHAARVLEGDEDHLVFYALQSTRITSAPPIEPALSARTLVTTLDPDTRARFLATPETLPSDRIPADARARLQAIVRAVEGQSDDPRLGYFRALLQGKATDARLTRAYARAMRFLAEQDRAGHTADAAGAVATLYRTRGLSTDTSVEAGFLVREGLATLRALEPARRIRRVVIIGPGFDLAPRTRFDESIPPQSLQPFAVADALVSLGLSNLASLQIACLDINPRVIAALNRVRQGALTLTLAAGLDASARVSPSAEFQRYVDTLGLAIGSPLAAEAGRAGRAKGRRVALRPDAVAAITASEADVVLDRTAIQADLVVVTNVLPYFDDRELSLALANIAAMLAPGGALLHNEARPDVGAIARAIGLPLVQSRTAILAVVRDAPPLYDSVFLHVRRQE